MKTQPEGFATLSLLVKTLPDQKDASSMIPYRCTSLLILKCLRYDWRSLELSLRDHNPLIEFDFPAARSILLCVSLIPSSLSSVREIWNFAFLSCCSPCSHLPHPHRWYPSDLAVDVGISSDSWTDDPKSHLAWHSGANSNHCSAGLARRTFVTYGLLFQSPSDCCCCFTLWLEGTLLRH